MIRYLLDTNVLLHMVNKSRGHELIARRLASENQDNVRISALTVWEIARMVEKAKVPTKATNAAISMMGLFEVQDLDASGASMGGSIHATLANKGLTISERDSMIAGIALIHGYTMVTDNTREYCRVPGLTVENWRAS